MVARAGRVWAMLKRIDYKTAALGNSPATRLP
jgi:hypothetical protein